MFSGAPFLLGKRLRFDDDTDVAVKDDAVSAVAAASVVPGTGDVLSGFWALPARPDFGQVWSFAARTDMLFPGPAVASQALMSGRFFQQQAPTPERGGSYFPIGQGHLNLLASLSGAAGSAGRRDNECH